MPAARSSAGSRRDGSRTSSSHSRPWPRAPGRTWQPTFVDYLFLSYTNATAFSPTDTLPLSHWAKLLMMAESAASLLLAIMVVARAVNILQ